MKNALIYTRVSTSGQALDGVSLEAQRARAEAWATANGYQVAGVFVDAGLSGKKASNRPELQKALAAIRKMKGSAIVVYSLSRLARSTRDAIDIGEKLHKAGADLVSLTEALDTTTAAGKMMFRMLAVLAEFERDLVSERTKTALAHKRANGERTGGLVPFGFRDDGGRLVPDDREKVVAERIAALRASRHSFEEISASLNAEGVTTKTGRAWTWRTVRLASLSSKRFGLVAA